MARIAKLIMVTGANNNKFYDMVEDGGQLVVTYGRVGQSSTTHRYPARKWDSLYRSKIKKGYKDVTGYRLEEASVDFTAIANDAVSAIVTELQALANRSVQRNYTVSSEAVTKAQVEEAQRLLDTLSALLGQGRLDTRRFDNMLLDLYQVIPRRMGNVRDHLLSAGLDPKRLVIREQATLDVMEGQVRVNAAKKANTADDKKNILQAMGLDIQVARPDDVKLIRKELGEISNRLSRAFYITNTRTQKKFNDFVEKSRNKTTKLFWHGSRNENWWSILDSGLVLRPTNAIITGRMFGHGLYFTDKAKKSYGYTSCRGSYWARGAADKGFMSLYDVHLGRTLTHRKHEAWMYSLTKSKLEDRGKYDSLTALGGVDLYNNEFIIYDEHQCTVKYLVEVN
jgi:poly [ADP-ribose] polymerase